MRYSLRRIRSGDIASVTSTGTLRTPLGNAVADRPSLPGRAPVPPEWNDITLKTRAFIISAESASIWLEPPKANRFHRQEVASAGNWAFRDWLRHPINRSGRVGPQ